MSTAKPTNIADQLRKGIAEADASMYRVAKDSGVDYTVVMRFMVKERGMTLDTAARLAEYLGLELRPVRGRKAKGR